MIPSRFTIFNTKTMEGVEFCMLAQWTADLVGKLHKHGITRKQLADEIGVTREYVSIVLNGHKEPAGAERNFTDALDRLIARKTAADSK